MSTCQKFDSSMKELGKWPFWIAFEEPELTQSRHVEIVGQFRHKTELG